MNNYYLLFYPFSLVAHHNWKTTKGHI